MMTTFPSCLAAATSADQSRSAADSDGGEPPAAGGVQLEVVSTTATAPSAKDMIRWSIRIFRIGIPRSQDLRRHSLRVGGPVCPGGRMRRLRTGGWLIQCVVIEGPVNVAELLACGYEDADRPLQETLGCRNPDEADRREHDRDGHKRGTNRVECKPRDPRARDP